MENPMERNLDIAREPGIDQAIARWLGANVKPVEESAYAGERAELERNLRDHLLAIGFSAEQIGEANLPTKISANFTSL